MRDFKRYRIWKLGMELAKKVYEIGNELPDEEKYGLKSQMRRSAISIPSNFAEGSSRSSRREFNRYLEISLGSAFELETHLLLVEQNYLLNTEDARWTLTMIQSSIFGLKQKLQNQID